MDLAIIIILGIALLVTNGLYTFIIIKMIDKHQAEKMDLHNRLMSREYPEYLQGEHTQQLLRSEEEKNKQKPKEHEKLDKDFVQHKKKAEQF